MVDLTNEIITLAKGYAGVDTIHVGSLPIDEAISIYLAPASDGERFFDKTGTYDASFTFLSKYEDQKSAISKLDAIGKGLEALKSFPVLDDMQIYNINYTTRVNYVDKDDDNKWIYAIVVTVNISDK